MSTVSAALHTLAGVIYNDCIRPQNWYAHTDANANLTMRSIIFVAGSFCALGGFMVENFQSIFQVISTVGGMSIGAVIGAFFLGMLYPWANTKVTEFNLLAFLNLEFINIESIRASYQE